MRALLTKCQSASLAGGWARLNRLMGCRFAEVSKILQSRLHAQVHGNHPPSLVSGLQVLKELYSSKRALAVNVAGLQHLDSLLTAMKEAP